MLFRHRVGTYQGNELTRNSSESAPLSSSQLAELLWTDPGRKSGLGVHELIATERLYYGKAQEGTDSANPPQKSSSYARKKRRPHQ